MNGEAIVTISATVVALVQLAKWAGVDSKHGPLAVLGCSLAGVAVWGWQHNELSRATSFEYLAGLIAVMTSAAGIFGFTRATGDTMTTFKTGQGTGPGGGSGLATVTTPGTGLGGDKETVITPIAKEKDTL